MSNHHEPVVKKSKAQQKRDAVAAQALGAKLVELTAAQLKTLSEKIDLPDTLLEALLLCQTIKAREGRINASSRLPHTLYSLCSFIWLSGGKFVLLYSASGRAPLQAGRLL